MQALIIGYTDRTSWQLPALLSRAGFVCDVLNPSPLFAKSQFVKRRFPVKASDSIVLVASQLLQIHDPYDWIIISEDEILQEVLDADIPLSIKKKLLPVISEEYFDHINSRIQLANVLQKNAIRCPAYRIVDSYEAACKAADEVGYPVLLKKEHTSGGQGVYDCQQRGDIPTHVFTRQRCLLQKKIQGIEVDVSAIYRQGQLIHYSYSTIKSTLMNSSISLLRTYRPLGYVDSAVMDELVAIGKSLGADGFVNISAIETSDKQRYYFECDMRPNVWVDYPRFYQDDPAKPIRRWFVDSVAFNAALHHIQLPQPRCLDIPYFERLSFFEILINRYNVWRYIPWQDIKLVRSLILRRLHLSLIKWRVTKWIPKGLKRLWFTASSF